VAWGMGPPDGPRRALWAALALAAFEILRSWIFTGFPWALIGSVWIEHPVAQLAAVVGVHGLTLFTVVLSVGVFTLSIWRASRRAILATGITVIFWGGGAYYGERAVEFYDAVAAQADPTPMVRIVQPNETQSLKWQPDMIPVFWERKLTLTALPAPVRPDVIIWPEVSVPYLLEEDGGFHPDIAQAAAGATVIAGMQRFVGLDLFNSLAVIGSDAVASQIYDKHHLVPFGEYLPGRPLMDRLGLQGLATDMLGNFSSGPGPRVLDLGPLGRVLPLICYEAIFPRHVRTSGDDRPDWIVHVTNDAWFGARVGPEQHLDQARFRAIEQGLPVVRSANTGISALIDPAGRIVKSLPMDTQGTIDAPIPPALSSTLYASYGNWPVVFLWGLLAVWLIGSNARKGH
ncbi:MAG: apolipoprotein N-acyltransferase, partial [Pseudomonadota bacterium]